VLVGGIPRGLRLRRFRHAPFGVAQYLCGRVAAVDVVGLPDLLLGQWHGTTGHTIFGNLGCHAQRLPRPDDRQPHRERPGNAAFRIVASWTST
jgi:hypothetical protein